MRSGKPTVRRLEPFELPETRTPALEETYRAIERDLHPEPDYDYPPHDEETFQGGYPHKGNGGYGSSGDF